MKWKCHKFQRWLVRSTDEPLPKKKQRKLAAHLGQCSVCREFQKNLTASLSLIQSEREIMVPEGVKNNVATGIRRALETAPHRRPDLAPAPPRIDLIPRLALAAVALAFLVSLGRLVFQKNLPQVSEKNRPKCVVIETALYRGQPAELSVFESPDGKTTFIWID